jgi:hypothetical protein
MAIILTVRHINGLWGVVPYERRTLALLKENQAAYVAKNPATQAPTEIVSEIPAYVGSGCWRVHCRCGERTHTNPEWKEACCFGCGAIWTNVVFPEDWQKIDTLLAKRAVQGMRNWQAPETLDDLITEQIAHGEPT